jgi:hypothetical protein
MEAFLYALAGTAIAGLFALAISKPIFYKQIEMTLFNAFNVCYIAQMIWTVSSIITASKLKDIMDPKLFAKANAISETLYVSPGLSTLVYVGIVTGFGVLHWFSRIALPSSPPS